ncbi:uncharacterized protein LOC129726784 [Wyeomyia smithii]|uniref:uncharacterized protein LOC129726784 n=1 Tax=Wyeomyia smithii TaxID=174621 RepID=UPI002467C48D|nr:uncharacterized protein LOC129726784 [Wyeomyia smithii]XP_055539857.1 uncharacterized protein LOC129726784 [Wyeomyia smithii]XP_055539866.1 uncharacterized protein LOC129726784 [Wyeomyia smithii]
MSCQQASRVQEDPYAFTEPAPLQANTSIYKHPHPNSSNACSGVTPTVIQAGTSLLTSNNGVSHVVQQRVSTGSSKVTPLKVTLVQSPSMTLAKNRFNGASVAGNPTGTVFRTVSVSVPQATTIMQRPVASAVSAQTIMTTSAIATAKPAPTTVFTKPFQVQISPQQIGKFSRRILASKSPNISPVGSTIQTLRIVKSASPQQQQQPIGGRPTITPDARRYLNHSNNSILGSPITIPATPAVITAKAAGQTVSVPIQAISPTKIRLIQPQSQGKIFLHTPNSTNSLAAATHISNPVSIAALRNSLVKQNPSLINKIPQTVASSQAATTLQASNTTILPAFKASPITTTSKPAVISIRRTSPPTANRPIAQPSATIVSSAVSAPVAVATQSPVITSTILTTPARTLISNTPTVQPIARSKTPTSILKPQVQQQQQSQVQKAPPISQDDIGFTIPSFVIPKQVPKVELPTAAKPIQPTMPIPVVAPSSSADSSIPSAETKQSTKSNKSSQSQPQGAKRTKRSYSRSSHHETLERISTPAKRATKGDHNESGADCGKPVPAVRFPKWKPPGAIAIPLNREWHAPGSYIYDIGTPGLTSPASIGHSDLTQQYWFEEMYASNELDAAEAATPLGMRSRKRRKAVVNEEAQNKLLWSTTDAESDLKPLSRDERLELKRAYLRRKAVQYWNAQQLRRATPARKRLKLVRKMLAQWDEQREATLKKNGNAEQSICQRPECNQVALLATTHCYQHITDNHEQRLFQQCTAKFSDNSQCRVPVFDINHELILCREHAWKHDNHDKMSAEVKLLKKPPASTAAKKKMPKLPSVSSPVVMRVAPATVTSTKANKKKNKKKLTPLQQQLALHQLHYKQQYSSIINTKPTVQTPAYGITSTIGNDQKMQSILPRQGSNSLHQQQQQQFKVQSHTSAPGGLIQTVSASQQAATARNVHIPLLQRQIVQPYQQQQQPILAVTQTHLNLHQQQQQHFSQNRTVNRNENIMLNYAAQQSQSVHQILGNSSTQDLLNICENSSAYASSEDTGVGGLSESELMVAQDVIEEIPFEIGNLNNVLSQLPPDAFNELLFSEQEQSAPTFESTQEEEEDLERALEVVGEHVKSLEDMTVESANFLGDFLDNVDDEMLDGTDICTDQMLQSPNTNDIRGLVHT